MQRILQPGEIEALDHTRLPRLRLPERASLLADRAARLRQLADGSPIADYLRLAARVAELQHRLLQTAETAPLDGGLAERAQRHAMPLAPAAQHVDPAWQGVLDRLLDALAGDDALPTALQPTLAALRASAAGERERQAQAVLAEAIAAADLPSALFVTAALQVAFIDRACRLREADVPYTDTPGLCPVCASKPVASVLRIGGAHGGLRYLHCGLCATEWHMVRVKCSHCGSTAAIRYEGIEGGPAHVLAETCGACHSYRKLVNQEQDPLAEPLADDLASLVLDLLMGETAFTRASANPFMPYAVNTPATSPEGSADA